MEKYTVSIQSESKGFNNFDFEASCLNSKDNLARNNQAIKEAIEFLETLPEEKKIGILITRKYIRSGNVHDIYSHIYIDESNWVTVREALDFLKNM